jgi:hypothetical protein
MGCDITGGIENKMCREDKYYFTCAKDIYIDRSYTLFGYLAGVRSIEKPIVEPRGLPEEMSDGLKELYEEWEGDAHTESWLTFREMRSLPEKFRSLPFYKTAEAYAEQHGENNVRFVFWFDN